jgi:hypothetical protein
VVTFLVFFAGQNPDVHIPAFTITKEIKDGRAEIEFKYIHPAWKPFPAEDPGFFVTAHSAWCPPIRSGNFTVRLKRPEVAEAAMHNGEGSGTETAEIGEKVVFAVTFGGGVEEGAPVAIKLYKDGADTQRDRPVKEWRTTVEESKAKAEWVCACWNDPENPLTEKPKFFYTVESPRCAAARSGSLEVSQSLCVEAVDGNGYYLGGGMEYELKHRSGECERGNCAGRIEKTGLIPGKWELVLSKSGQGEREGENRTKAEAQDEDATVLEFTPQEVIGRAVEVHTGSRVRIIVKEGALQHSDDAGNKASGGTRT